MIGEKARRILIPAALCVAFFAALLVLVATLDDVALGPGQSSPREGSAEDKSEAGGAAFEIDVTFLRHLLFLAFTVSLAVVLISAVFARPLRRWLYFAIGLFGALVLFDLFATNLPSSPSAPTDPVQVQSVALADEAQPTEWGRVLIALGLSLGAGAALAVGTSWVVTRWRASRSRRPTAGGELAWELELLAEQTLHARHDADLVLRCYREMVDLLSRRTQIAHASLTAREFATSLRELGLRSDAIDRLTALFELVRYGHRDSMPLASRAVESLAEIRGSDRFPEAQSSGPSVLKAPAATPTASMSGSDRATSLVLQGGGLTRDATVPSRRHGADDA